MKKLYIIAGCNGAGKTTTSSYAILPEILECEEFVNADEIAKGLSPFNPEKAGIQAGRLMLQRIKSMIQSEQNFAFETTLSTKSCKNFVIEAQKNEFSVTLLFLAKFSKPCCKTCRNKSKRGRTQYIGGCNSKEI